MLVLILCCVEFAAGAGQVVVGGQEKMDIVKVSECRVAATIQCEFVIMVLYYLI